MNTATVNKWHRRHVSYGSYVPGQGKASFEARSDGKAIQKAVERAVYETPYSTPLGKWTAELNTIGEGLVDPTITIRSYDGGEYGGFYESPSSEITISGWIEDLSEEELVAAQEAFGL